MTSSACQGIRSLMGYDIDKIAASMMRDLRVMERVEIRLDSRGARARADAPELGGTTYVIHLPSPSTVKRAMPYLTREEIRAKSIAQLAEEVSHIAVHETCHDKPTKPVVKMTIRLMKRYMTKRQLNLKYIREEKMEDLRRGEEFDAECED